MVALGRRVRHPRMACHGPRLRPPRQFREHIKAGRTFYSVPWKLIGRKVDVRSTATMVQVFLDGELVKTHAALEQGKRTDSGDYPPVMWNLQLSVNRTCFGSGDRVRP